MLTGSSTRSKPTPSATRPIGLDRRRFQRCLPHAGGGARGANVAGADDPRGRAHPAGESDSGALATSGLRDARKRRLRRGRRLKRGRLARATTGGRLRRGGHSRSEGHVAGDCQWRRDDGRQARTAGTEDLQTRFGLWWRRGHRRRPPLSRRSRFGLRRARELADELRRGGWAHSQRLDLQGRSRQLEH